MPKSQAMCQVFFVFENVKFHLFLESSYRKLAESTWELLAWYHFETGSLLYLASVEVPEPLPL